MLIAFFSATLVHFLTCLVARVVVRVLFCGQLDVITPSVMLPELETGDWLYFSRMGAYTISLASCFNGYEKPNTLYIWTEQDIDFPKGEEAPGLSSATEKRKRASTKRPRRGMKRRMVRLRKKKGKLRRGKPTTKKGKIRVK